MKLTIKTTAGEVAASLDALPARLGARAVRRALVATQRNLRTELTKRLGKKVALKAAAIKDTIKADPPGAGEISATLEVRYRPVELHHYSHRQLKRGVSARVLKTERRRLYTRAFVGKGSLPSHVYRREGAPRPATRGRYAGKTVTRGPRKGRPLLRQPIKKLYGPSVRKEAEPILRELHESGWISDRLVENLRQAVTGVLEAQARRAAKTGSGT